MPDGGKSSCRVRAEPSHIPPVPLALAPLQRRPPADPPPAAPPVASFPLSYYRHSSFYTLRTDARAQIRVMCSTAGLVELRFSTRAPCWCVAGGKAEGVAALASTAVL